MLNAPTDFEWFKALTGFDELPYDRTRRRLRASRDRRTLTTLVGKLPLGVFSTPNLSTLIEAMPTPKGSTVPQVTPIREDVFKLHHYPDSNGATFQVASQFNCLEGLGPNASELHGVSRYVYDRTQGPACALACPADLIYRNYFKPDIDLTDGLSSKLASYGLITPWNMKNGYLLPLGNYTLQTSKWIAALPGDQRESLLTSMRVGLLTNAHVSVGPNTVNQVYCSTLPLNYYRVIGEPGDYQGLAALFLEAAYLGTLAAAAVNMGAGGSGQVFLTYIGGGAFANPPDWIGEALSRALLRMRGQDLSVYLVERPK